MKKIKLWTFIILTRFFGSFAIVLSFIVLNHGDPITPIFLMIPGIILLCAPILD